MRHAAVLAAWASLTWYALYAAAEAVWLGLTGGAALVPPFSDKYFEMPVLVVVHGLAAVAALAAGPFQMLASLRARLPRFHRTVGAAYAGAVVVAAATGFALGIVAEGGPIARFAFCLISVAWLATLVKAVAAARCGDIATHRRFVLRNYALTFGAVTLRVYLRALTAGEWELPEVYALAVCAAWIPNVVLVEFVIGAMERRRTIA